MGSERRNVSVWGVDGVELERKIELPKVFDTPIRPDIVQYVFTNLSKNTRQPHGVSKLAGHQHSAESWGTGRAAARVPRVSGGGTHRSGQGAFANSCRKGRMFAPIKVWRKWFRKTSLKQRRYAIASAIAATAIPSLVHARGHRINDVPEIPYVFDNSIQSITRTKEAVKFINDVRLGEEINKVKTTISHRAGKGKYRNRRLTSRKGPLIVYNEDNGITRAFRNIPGVELIHVSRLSLKSLAPGSQLGRLVIWSEGAFGSLNDIYDEKEKTGYSLPVSVIKNQDISRIINSAEVQSVLREAGSRRLRPKEIKKNPLKNKAQMLKLNPYSAVAKKDAMNMRNEIRKEAKETRESMKKSSILYNAMKID